MPPCQRISGKHLSHALHVVSWHRRSQLAVLLVAVWSEVLKAEAVNPLTQFWPWAPEQRVQIALLES